MSPDHRPLTDRRRMLPPEVCALNREETDVRRADQDARRHPVLPVFGDHRDMPTLLPITPALTTQSLATPEKSSGPRARLLEARRLSLTETTGRLGSSECAVARSGSSTCPPRSSTRLCGRGAERPTRDRRLHDRPTLAPRVTRTSSSCSNVSPIASAAPEPAASRASFEG